MTCNFIFSQDSHNLLFFGKSIVVQKQEEKNDLFYTMLIAVLYFRRFLQEEIMGNEVSQKKNEKIRIPFWNKVGYGMGEVGCQLSFTMVSSYLTIFYTNVVGLTPMVISMIMLVARIWDAVNDPMFGSIAENTRSKWGRFRPYILYGTPVLAITTSLTFQNLDLPNIWKTIWCAATYIACGMAYTSVSISVGSLANSMTVDNQERVTLNSFRGALSSGIGIIMSAVTMPFILFFGKGNANSAKGFFLAATIFAAVSIPCLWICVFSTKEVVGGGAVQNGEKHSAVKNLAVSFKVAFKDRDTALLIIAMVFYLTGVFGRLGIMAYYFFNVFGNPALIAWSGTALSLGMLVPNFYVPFLTKVMNKKTVCCLAALFQAISCVGFFAAGEAKAVVPMVIISFIYGATNCGGLGSFGLVAEIIDDSWLRTGVRADGMIYASISFATKLGNAIGGSIGIILLGAVGFVANTDLSASVITKMNAVINLGPAFMFLLSIIPFGFITMTNKRGKENEETIRTRMEQTKKEVKSEA